MERVINEGTEMYRRPPSTQNGEPQDLSAKHVQDGSVFPADDVLMADAPDRTPPTTPLEDGTKNGAWDSGQNVPGWHPGK